MAAVQSRGPLNNRRLAATGVSGDFSKWKRHARSRAAVLPDAEHFYLAGEAEAPVCFYSGLSKLRPVVYHNTRARGFTG